MSKYWKINKEQVQTTIQEFLELTAAITMIMVNTILTIIFANLSLHGKVTLPDDTGIVLSMFTLGQLMIWSHVFFKTLKEKKEDDVE